jgi:hypothetical protein
MPGDIALAGFMMTAEEWAALDAPSRALLLAIDEPGLPRRGSTPEWECGAIDAKPDDFAHDEAVVEIAVYAVGTSPITDEEATV